MSAIIRSTFVHNCLLFWIASLGQLSQLRQVIDENHRRSLESISDTFQSRFSTRNENLPLLIAKRFG